MQGSRHNQEKQGHRDMPAIKVRDVSHMLKAIHAQESRAAADQ
jgi:hypothetical protein